jgi:hypothetical protein
MVTGGALTSGIKRLGREADRSLHLLSRIRIRGAIPPFPGTSPWRGVILAQEENLPLLLLLLLLS